MTSPLIVGQKVFIATTDDNTSLNTYICAFDFHSGKQLWKFRTENSVKNTIACENEIVVAQDASCNLYALDAASGKPLWQQYINLKNYPYLYIKSIFHFHIQILFLILHYNCLLNYL